MKLSNVHLVLINVCDIMSSLKTTILNTKCVVILAGSDDICHGWMTSFMVFDVIIYNRVMFLISLWSPKMYLPFSLLFIFLIC